MNRSTFTGRSHRLSSSSGILRAALLAVPAVAVTWASAPVAADAASLYWDLNGATPGATDDAGGVVSGTWNAANSNWSASAAGDAATTSWTELDTAVFSAGTNGTGVSTITVEGAISSAGLTLEEGTLTFAGDALTLAGVNTAGANVTTMNNVIDNTAGVFTKTGPGTLALRANMVGNATSVVRIEGGVFNIDSSSRFGTQGKIVLDNGATLVQANTGFAGPFISGATTLEIGPNGGTVDYNVATVTPSISGISIYGGTNANGFIGGTGTLTKTGIGEFRYQGAGLPSTTFTRLIVKEGLFRLGFNSATMDERGWGGAPVDAKHDAITLDGGSIGASFSHTLHVNRGITVTENGGTINLTAASMTMPNGNSKLTGTGKLTLLGSATQGLVLNAPLSDFSGALDINGVFTMGSGVNLSVKSLAGPVAGLGRISVASGGMFTFGTDNTDTSYNGRIAGSGGFTKAGTGTFLMATEEYTNSGPTNITGGTIRFGDVDAGLGNASTVTISAGATLDMNGIEDTVGALAGAGAVSNGAALIVAGSNTDPVTYSGNYSGTGAFTKQGAGVQNLAGTNTFASVTVDAGTLGVHSSGALAGDLSVQNDARVQYLPTVTGTIASKVGTVTVGAAAKIDLVDNKLITSSPVGTFVGGAYTEVSGLVDTARGNLGSPLWDGASGITTSDTRAQGKNLVSIGVAKVGQIKGVADGATTTFAGQTVLGSDTVAMVTWGGDATLDGKINIDDYGRIDANVSQSGTVFGWYNGDFNYDGAINIDDYGIIDGNISNQGTTFVTSSGALAAAEGVSAVPEPASLSLLALGAMGLMRRRRHA